MQRTYLAKPRMPGIRRSLYSPCYGFLFSSECHGTQAPPMIASRNASPQDLKTPTSCAANKRLSSIFFTKSKQPSAERRARWAFTPRRRLLSSALGALTALTAHVSMFIVGNSRENTRKRDDAPDTFASTRRRWQSDCRRNASTNRRHDPSSTFWARRSQFKGDFVGFDFLTPTLFGGLSCATLLLNVQCKRFEPSVCTSAKYVFLFP